MEAILSGSKPAMIHIVDDDDAVRSAVQLLVRSFGWRAQAFESATDYLDALPQGAPDCLLLDLNMPGMDGAELLRVVTGRHPGLPVIVITGEPQSPLAARALQGGAREVLDKPFGELELRRSIERSVG